MGGGLTKEDKKSRNQGSRPQVEVAAPLESREDLISAEGLSTPQPGPGSLARCAHWRDGDRKGSNLISRATLCLHFWRLLPKAATSLQTLTGEYCEKTADTSGCTQLLGGNP